MGLDKSEVKLAILHNLGCKVDDMLEGVRHERFRAEGASRALVQATKAIRQLAELVDDDVDKERYELPTAAKIKEYLDRAASLVESMASNARNQQLAGSGRTEAMDQVVKYLKKEYDLEEAKKQAFEAAVEEDEAEADVRPQERAVGQRPGRTIKQQRLAEEEAASDTPPLPEPDKKKKTLSLKERLTRKSKSDYAKDS